MWSVWLVFCDCGFHSVCPGKIRIRGLWRLPHGRDWLWKNLGLVLMGGAMLTKSLIQFFSHWQGCLPSLLFGLRPNYGRGNGSNGDLLQKGLCQRCCVQCPQQATVHSCVHQRLLDTHKQVWLSLLWGRYSFLLGPGVHKVLFVPTRSLFLQSCGSSVVKSHSPPNWNSLGVLSPFAGSPGWEICCGS